ncbi:MAG: PEP-CTERM sorting domain-containing protein [Phycisphaerae bacterium]|nr:PEP-CTERM sorting domain-containing protein [Tepidisphaeraceae bacterium]
MLLAPAPSAHAAVLSLYSFTPNDNTTAFDVTSELSGVDSTAVSQVGLPVFNSSGSGSSSILPPTTSGRARFMNISNSANSPDVVDDNLATDSYVGFRLTPDVTENAGALALDVDSLTFFCQVDGASTVSINWVLTADLTPNDGIDNFVNLGTRNVIANADGDATTSADGGDYVLVTYTFDSTFDFLPEGVVFRLNLLDNGQSTTVRYDEVTVNGSLAVPEPGAVGGIAVAGLAALARRRRAQTSV